MTVITDTITRADLATLLATCQPSDKDAFIAELERITGKRVEPEVDGVTKRAREIAAKYWDSKGCRTDAAECRSGKADKCNWVQSARAAILEDLAIVEQVRGMAENDAYHGDGWRSACAAITAAMKGINS